MTVKFEEFAAGLSYADIPEEMRALLRVSFADTMGVAAIGSRSDMSNAAKASTVRLFGAGTAGASRMLLDGRKASPVGAAMAGAFTVDSIDAHDGTTPNKGHVGSAVFPALLAVADALRSEGRVVTGADFALWLALAYEVSSRAGKAQHATCPDYHTSGSWTAVGVAVAVGRMLGATQEQLRHAAGIAEYHGPRSQMMRCIDHPSMVRDGVGWGAPTGVTAGYLALDSFTGAPALTCESDEAAPYWEGLGESWMTLADTHYKKYPCCRWAHPSMDAAIGLMQEHGLAHYEIAKVEIRTFHYATRLAGHRPTSMDELAYSIAFPVATVIVRGGFGADEMHDSVLTDADILRISEATELIDDDEMTAISVDKRWAQVTLITKDGRRYSAEPQSARGDVDNPLSAAEMDDKYHLFADPVLGRPRAEKLKALCQRFDTLDAEGFAELLDLALEAP
ncbi:MmgE/PrpD family protein [Lentibacter algarum]|uniref:MmgE/PrpD family protein n=1 Tax=Lentibacter algarum TaxID=576131 RepID=UPI001C06D7F3|nr:MmgE/PrpD family protein [Lentibacter algarum]MBU2980399.1 MmgE/PrpD family protein [Lentibacter algarum]